MRPDDFRPLHFGQLACVMGKSGLRSQSNLARVPGIGNRAQRTGVERAVRIRHDGNPLTIARISGLFLLALGDRRVRIKGYA